jgi:hypothetical protein
MMHISYARREIRRILSVGSDTLANE